MRDKQESKNLDVVAYVFSVLRRLSRRLAITDCKANLDYRVRALYFSLPSHHQKRDRLGGISII